MINFKNLIYKQLPNKKKNKTKKAFKKIKTFQVPFRFLHFPSKQRTKRLKIFTLKNVESFFCLDIKTCTKFSQKKNSKACNFIRFL